MASRSGGGSGGPVGLGQKEAHTDMDKLAIRERLLLSDRRQEVTTNLGGEFDRDTDTPIIGAGMGGHVYYQAGTHGPSHNHNKHSSHCGSLTRGIWMVSTWTLYNIDR